MQVLWCSRVVLQLKEETVLQLGGLSLSLHVAKPWFSFTEQDTEFPPVLYHVHYICEQQ